MDQSKDVALLIQQSRKIFQQIRQSYLFDVDKVDLKAKAEKLIKSIERKINFYDFSYYEKNISLISDPEYDNLRLELNKLLKQFPDLKKLDSTTNQVGSQLNFSLFHKSNHIYPMLSLNNAFNDQDIMLWYKSVKQIEDINDEILINIEPKIDGVSLGLHYRFGKLDLALTRGNGQIGEDITHNVRFIGDIPQIINCNDPLLEIRGEVYLTKQNFILLNEEYNYYSTSRNSASGILRQKIPKINTMQKLNFFAYGIGGYDFSNNKNLTKHSEIMRFLKTLNFKIVSQLGLFNSLESIFNTYQQIYKKRSELEYDIDGIVLKVDQLYYQQILDCDSRSPRWAIAYKFPALDALTKILQINIQVGRSGILTPIAILDPINIGGSFIARATLHNENYIQNNDIRIGDIVKVKRAGDIIPQVIESFPDKRTQELATWASLEYCPSCSTKTIKNNAYCYCMNHKSCPEQIIANLKHFISKDAFDIQGLGNKTIHKFYYEQILKNPSDIFNLKNRITDKKKLEHFNKLFLVIESRKTITLDRFIYAIGIPNIGKNIAKIISNLYDNVENWLDDMQNLDKDKNKILLIHGMGKVIVDSLVKYFNDEDNIIEIQKMLSCLNVIANTKNNNHLLQNEIVVFTGSLLNMNRNKAVTIAQNLGAKVSNVITKKVTLVISGYDAGNKLQKAIDLNIKIINEDQWMELINT